MFEPLGTSIRAGSEFIQRVLLRPTQNTFQDVVPIQFQQIRLFCKYYLGMEKATFQANFADFHLKRQVSSFSGRQCFKLRIRALQLFKFIIPSAPLQSHIVEFVQRWFHSLSLALVMLLDWISKPIRPRELLFNATTNSRSTSHRQTSTVRSKSFKSCISIGAAKNIFPSFVP